MKSEIPGEIIQFKNCCILRNHEILREDLWIRDGKVINPEKVFFDEKIKADKQIDCNGALICPGFIDIQINGGFGIDFSQSDTVTHDGVEKVAKGILAHGVTAFCPTLVTSPPKVYEKGLIGSLLVLGVTQEQGKSKILEGMEKFDRLNVMTLPSCNNWVVRACSHIVCDGGTRDISVNVSLVWGWGLGKGWGEEVKVLSVINKKQGGKHGATILGIHLEGPFINPEKKGAHPPSCIQTFAKGANSLSEVYRNLEDVVLVTLAPEIVGATEVIETLVKRGIVVSLGHSQASLEEAEQAFEHGASLITHLFNAMLPFHHRDPGLVGLLASDTVQNERTIFFGIIADGVHTHPAALRIAHRIHPKGLILVTDAVSALGFEEGSHTIGQKSVQIKNGCAFISGTNTLCGSIATMNFSVKYFRKATGCSVVEALEAATLHPALALNISERKGTLNFGSDADFVLLTNELDVVSTWIGGECVYEGKVL